MHPSRRFVACRGGRSDGRVYCGRASAEGVWSRSSCEGEECARARVNGFRTSQANAKRRSDLRGDAVDRQARSREENLRRVPNAFEEQRPDRLVRAARDALDKMRASADNPQQSAEAKAKRVRSNAERTRLAK